MTIIIHPPEQSRVNTGWLGQLDLEISCKKGRSIVGRSHQQGPLTLQRPFYPEEKDDICHLYLLHPPAGIVGGDRLQLNVSCRNGGAALLTTPGATKFYRSSARCAAQHQQFTIMADSSLEWLPQETIYYPDSHAEVTTVVNLQGNGSFIGWDVHCLGLPAIAHDLGRGQVHIHLTINRNKRPLLIESLSITEEKKHFQAAFLRDQPVFATFVATGADKALLELVREHIPTGCEGIRGATLVEDILIIRYLGPSVNEARKIFLFAWQTVRPAILGRKSRQPRIWAT